MLVLVAAPRGCRAPEQPRLWTPAFLRVCGDPVFLLLCRGIGAGGHARVRCRARGLAVRQGVEHASPEYCAAWPPRVAAVLLSGMLPVLLVSVPMQTVCQSPGVARMYAMSLFSSGLLWRAVAGTGRITRMRDCQKCRADSGDRFCRSEMSVRRVPCPHRVTRGLSLGR